jgi:predicted hotdog family 3-hydroxylacyl-ACP dehydratase
LKLRQPHGPCLKMSLVLENLLPHRAPMLWIEELTTCTEREAIARANFKEGDFAVSNGGVLESALVECMAQTVAAAQGERARRSGNAGASVGGMLAAITDFRVQAQAPIGKPLQIEVRELKRFGPMLLVSGEIKSDGRIIASGQLSLYA